MTSPTRQGITIETKNSHLFIRTCKRAMSSSSLSGFKRSLPCSWDCVLGHLFLLSAEPCGQFCVILRGYVLLKVYDVAHAV